MTDKTPEKRKVVLTAPCVRWARLVALGPKRTFTALAAHMQAFLKAVAGAEAGPLHLSCAELGAGLDVPVLHKGNQASESAG